MTFSQRLEELLKRKKVTWKEVSVELGIGKNQQKYWSDKDIAPDGKTLVKLAEYFGVSSDYLLGIEGLKQQSLDLLDNQTLTLSAKEVQLVLKYRKLDDEGRTMVESTLIQELRRIATDKGEADTASVG